MINRETHESTKHTKPKILLFASFASFAFS
jgi:hypothetical protein